MCIIWLILTVWLCIKPVPIDVSGISFIVCIIRPSDTKDTLYYIMLTPYNINTIRFIYKINKSTINIHKL